jgi:hypothetical protein
MDAALALFCQLRDERCAQACEEFEYEPGTDEQELRDMRAPMAGRQAHAEGRAVLRADVREVPQRRRVSVRVHAGVIDRRAVRAGSAHVEG